MCYFVTYKFGMLLVVNHHICCLLYTSSGKDGRYFHGGMNVGQKFTVIKVNLTTSKDVPYCHNNIIVLYYKLSSFSQLIYTINDIEFSNHRYTQND